MATARDIVTRAMRKRLRESGLVPTADELVDGLQDLNDMLFDWEHDGIPLGHVTVAAEDTLDVPDDHLSTITLSLAERLTDFGGELDPVDTRNAFEGRKRLQALYFSMDELSFDTGLARRTDSVSDLF